MAAPPMAPPVAPPVAIGATLAAAESEEPSLEPPSSPGSSVLRSQIQETIQKMAGLISQMDVVEEKVFRATDASSALRCCGRALNPNCREDMYDWSFPTQTINCFWSHSWHAEPWKNYLLLLVMYNGRMAVLAGSLAAFLAMLLFYLGLVPSYQRTFAIEGASYDFGPYGLSAGCIVSAWVLLLLPPKGSRIFLDRICIHQSDHDLKMAGILSIGGFLKRSESMLVLWDTTYATRLWTVFELAAFLKSRESRETCRLSSDLVVRPSILGLAAIAGFISVAAMNLGNQIISADNLTQAIFTVTLLILVIMVVGAHWLRIYFRNIDECRSQLKNFSLTWARSHCCTVNHVNESGNIIICDREIIMECIRSWFGSQEAFEDSVQQQVSATLVKGLGHYAFPFSWFLGLTVPTVWAYGDLMVARLRANELYYGLVGLVNLLTTWGVATPFCFVLSQMLAYKLRQRRRNRFLDYTVTLLGVVLIGAMGVGIQIFRNLLVTWLDDDLLGISAWALVMIFAVVVAWRCWPNRYDDDVDEGAGHTSAKSR